MSGASKIEWTDATWNPVTGCTKLSPGCKHCYAKTLHDKRHKAFLSGKKMPAQYAQPFERVMLHPERLDWPLRWRGSPVARAEGRLSRIFVNSVSDLFHEDVPDEFIDQVFAVMALRREHIFQVLTKRADRMHAYLGAQPLVRRRWEDEIRKRQSGELRGICPTPLLPNVWLGVSAEDQKTFDERWRYLRETPAAVRFVSAEPLLGRIDATHSCNGFEFCDALRGRKWHDADPGARAQTAHLDLVICGGESGSEARPSHPDYFRSLRDQCMAAGVAFNFKQWGAWGPVGPIYSDDDTPEHLDALECDDEGPKECHVTPSGGRWIARLDGQPPPGTWAMQKIGKHASGRLLDGIEHNEYPASPLTTTKEPQ